ncbi:hypothetical protein [Fimbriiglobus ruber]|uniref:Lipoprotein n=1 Tax=Fimbriiglobus ruber TaxID=1908690 RepID=A0A225E0E1_9BACT|nr:hypothetical protein [Fimbriiglobus ruber]OWK45274.1 hypothetical protein FRUB_01605 [Fimbriiglobus ruber]
MRFASRFACLSVVLACAVASGCGQKAGTGEQPGAADAPADGHVVAEAAKPAAPSPLPTPAAPQPVEAGAPGKTASPVQEKPQSGGTPGGGQATAGPSAGGGQPLWKKAIGGSKSDSAYLKLPADGGAWPWKLAAAPVEQPAKPVWFNGHGTAETRTTGVVVSPSAGRAVAVLTKTTPKQFTNHLIWCDLGTGQTTGQWSLDGDCVPLDIHPNGRQVLLRRERSRSGDIMGARIELWTLAADQAPKIQRWFVDPDHAPAQTTLTWGGFVGGNRVATLTAAGRFEVWAADTLARVGWFDAVPCVPAVSPDGTAVAVQVPTGVALYSATTGTVVGTRGVPEIPTYSIFAFRPNAGAIACVGEGRVVTLNLESGATATTRMTDLHPYTSHRQPEIGWADSRHVFAHDTLYEIGVALPVWKYSRAVWAKPVGRQVWALVPPRNERDLVLTAFDLPHPAAKQVDSNAESRPGVFVLKPGDAIKIDVTGVESPRRDETYAALEKLVRTTGYRPAKTAAASLVATVDLDGPTRKYTTIDLLDRGLSGDLTYKERHARLKLVKGDAILWENAATTPPGSDDPDSTTYKTGTPDYRLYSRAALPAFIRGQADLPTAPESYLTPRGRVMTPDAWKKDASPMGPS